MHAGRQAGQAADAAAGEESTAQHSREAAETQALEYSRCSRCITGNQSDSSADDVRKKLLFCFLKACRKGPQGGSLERGPPLPLAALSPHTHIAQGSQPLFSTQTPEKKVCTLH